MKNTILLVDDEPSVTASLKRVLMDEGYKIFIAESGEKGLEILRRHPMKVIISDEKMPGMSGAEFLATVKERYSDTIRIMLTGHASLEATMKAVNSGEIYRFFTKPWNNIELKLSIRGAMEKHDLETENRRLLQTVKRQAIELKLVEKEYPGITRLKRDQNGTITLPDLPEEEYMAIVRECEKEIV